MRFLAFLLIIAVLFTAIGFSRGWFSIRTSEAASRNEVTLGVDSGKVRSDAEAAAREFEEVTAAAAESVRSLARNLGPQQSALEGKLTAVDALARRIVVAAGGRTIELHVAGAVPVVKDGKDVGFDALLPGANVDLTFDHAGDDRALSRIMIR